MKECDVDKDFLSDSYLLIFSPYGAKHVTQQLNAGTFLISKNYALVSINVRTMAC